MKRLLSSFFAVASLVACTPSETTPSTSTTTDIETLLAEGGEYAMATQKALGGKLMSAIQSGGPAHAVDFCSAAALPITDSLAQHLGVKIKRVSDRNRNPKNSANELELAYIYSAQEAIKAGQSPAPSGRLEGRTFTGYYPITLGALCLNCHGEVGTEIAPSTAAVIDTKYPEDRATGYDLDELRGIWVVAFETKNP